jgi:hypothetical protein
MEKKRCDVLQGFTASNRRDCLAPEPALGIPKCSVREAIRTGL